MPAKLTIEVTSAAEAEQAIAVLQRYIEAGAPARDVSIETLGLSVRSRNILMGADILTTTDLRARTRDDLLRIPNMGRISLLEIQSKLLEHDNER